MASLIATIFDRIADLVVTVNGTDITGYKLADITDVINQTPKRIISPLSERDEGREAVEFTLGTQYKVRWLITDLLCWNAVEDGSGLEHEMQYLVAYKGAYLDMLRINRKLGFTGGHVQVEQAQLQIGNFEYPMNSGRWYHGCKAELTILEIVP